MTLSQLRRIVVRGAGVTVLLCGEAGLGKSYRARRALSDLSARQFSFSAQWPLARLPEPDCPANAGASRWPPNTWRGTSASGSVRRSFRGCCGAEGTTKNQETRYD